MTSWGFAWVAGGNSNGTVTGTIELFNPETGQFQAIGALNTARAEFAMTAVGRNLVIAGGTDGSNTLRSVEMYDGSLGTLTVAGAMSQAASGSLTTTISISSSTAAMFTANNSGSGPLAAQVVAVEPGGRQTYTDTAALSGATFVSAPISLSPAADTFYLLLYGTGFDTGKSVTVAINGQTFTPSYFGPQGGFAGLDQVNVLLAGEPGRLRPGECIHHRGRPNVQRGLYCIRSRRNELVPWKR